MKFLEDTGAVRATISDEVLVMMTRAEMQLIGEALSAHSSANKRQRKLASLSKEWNEKAPIWVG